RLTAPPPTATSPLSLHDALPISQHRAAAAAPGRLGHAAGPADRARAAGGAYGRAADGTHPATPVARALRSHAARRSEGAGRARVDRKSTRLNSSHVSISYAVFCL